jgi:hypothetical protein
MNRSDYIYREFPKFLTSPRGPVIVHSIAEERALVETPSVEPDTAAAPRPDRVQPTAKTQGASGMPDARQPGAPVITAQDRSERQAWRRERISNLQRERRHRLRRIDYYPSEDAAAIIDKLRTRGVGGDASSILNRILSEWAAIPELNRGK